jgi:YebC/PmpR family DNA-binding regulatory protein
MSGHSKWSTIKHKKAANDKKRGMMFTKMLKEISVAAKLGGGDPSGNARLRTAILKAKENSVPKDNIERSIKKGTGELSATVFEEFTYEGYGPDGVAILMDIMTDNKNRTAGDVRSAMTKAGGNLGANGCVGFIFEKKGVILFDIASLSEEKAMEIGAESGAEDIWVDPKNIEVTTTPENFEQVLKAFDAAGIKHLSAELTMVPNTYQDVTAERVEKILNLIDKLEELDDVQNVYNNMNIPDDYNA